MSNGVGSGMIDRSSLKQLIERIDLAQHIAQYLEVRRSGVNHTCCCPFHIEKTASFHIYNDHFYCFGCKKTGDILTFEMHRTGLDFAEVARRVSEQYGVPLQYSSSPNYDPAQRERRQRLLQMMNLASDFFISELHSAHGKSAVQYLNDRGISEEQAKQWQFGLAPAGNQLLRLSKSNNLSLDDLAGAGLVRKAPPPDDHYYDFFRNRLMLPIRDEKGNIVAFGGRLFQGTPDEVNGHRKYVHSAETELFSKSRTLFNFSNARSAITQSGTAIVVEGYMDCISLVNAGFPNVIAVLGTALTGEHVRLLARAAKRIILCFDSDSSGQNAAKKTFETVFPLNLVELYFISVPEGKDPDEYIRAQGRAAFIKLIEQPISSLDRVIQWIAAGQGSTSEKLREAKQNLLPVILKNPDLAQRELAVSRVAQFFGISPAAFHLETATVTTTQKALSLPTRNEAVAASEPNQERLAKPIWIANRDVEVKLVLALAFCRYEELPAFLREILEHCANSTLSPESERMAGLLSLVLTEHGLALVENIVLFLKRNPSTRLCECTQSLLDSMSLEFQTIAGLSGGDASRFTHSEAVRAVLEEEASAVVRFIAGTNLFSGGNLAFLKFVAKSNAAALRIGKIANVVDGCMRQLEILANVEAALSQERIES